MSGQEACEAIRDGIHRFSVECVLLACHYISGRHADIDMSMVKSRFVCDRTMPWCGNEQLFRVTAVKMRKAVNFDECANKPLDLYYSFRRTLCAFRSRAAPEYLSKAFTEDLNQVIFQCNIDWHKIVRAVLMTAMYVKEVEVCGQQYVAAILDGLLHAMKSQSGGKLNYLDGWADFTNDHYDCAQELPNEASAAAAAPAKDCSLPAPPCCTPPSNCPKQDDCEDTPSLIPGSVPAEPVQAVLTFAVEGRELLVDLICAKLGLNVMCPPWNCLSMFPPSKPRPESLTRRICIMRNKLECDAFCGCTIKKILDKHNCLFQRTFYSAKASKQLQCILKDYLNKVLYEVPCDGWPVVLATYIMCVELIRCLACNRSPCTNDLIMRIVSAHYEALEENTRSVEVCLGGWRGLEDKFDL